MSLRHLVLQARNNAWANRVLYEAVCGMKDGPLRAPYPSFFGTIPRTLNHIYEVDLFYLDGIVGGGLGRSVYERDDISDMAALAAAQAAQDAALIAYCTDMTQNMANALCDLARPTAMTRERVDHTLLHLFQHQIHHRGQVHSMLSQAGAEPPQLDDFYLEYGRVATAKPYWEET
jgi:uncharacterized damage-inducible protein DinB